MNRTLNIHLKELQETAENRVQQIIDAIKENEDKIFVPYKNKLCYYLIAQLAKSWKEII